MALIKIAGYNQNLPAKLTTSILNVLLENQFPIETICGGRAQCGRDLIRIISGAEFLSPRRELEARKLDALAREGHPMGPEFRLA